MSFRVELIPDDPDGESKSLDLKEFVQEMVDQGAISDLTSALSLPEFETETVDKTSTAIAYLDAIDIHNNGTAMQFSGHSLGSNWSRNDNVISYAGSADQITITANIFAQDAGASSYWGRPSIRVTNGAGEVVGQMDDLAMQQNNAYSGNVQITGTIVINEPSNTEYTFELFDTDNRVSTLTPIYSSHIAITAMSKVEVIKS